MSTKQHPSKSVPVVGRGAKKSTSTLDLVIKQVKKYWYVPAFIVAAALYMSYQGSADYTVIPIDDTEALKTVFFSGLPWLVYCSNGGSGSALTAPSHLIKTARAFPGASKNSISKPSDTLNIGLVDCDSKLPSGKSILERFSLTSLRPSINAHEQAAIFVVSNGNRPAPVTEDFRNVKQAGEAMVKYALREVEPRVISFVKSEYFAKQCANQKACAVVIGKGTLTKEQKDLVGDVAKRFRYINFATLDARKVKLDFDEPLNEADPSYIAAEKSSQFTGLDNREPFTWNSQPTSQKDIFELESQRWPKVLAFRGIPNPIPAHLRPKTDDKKSDSAKRPVASEPFFISAMSKALNNSKQLEDFLATFFGVPSSITGLASHAEAAKSWKPEIATKPTTSLGVSLYNRKEMARERLRKRKERAEQRARLRKQRAKETARLEELEKENVLVEQVPKDAPAEGNQGEASGAASAFDNVSADSSATPSEDGSTAKPSVVEDEDEEVVVA